MNQWWVRCPDCGADVRAGFEEDHLEKRCWGRDQ